MSDMCPSAGADSRCQEARHRRLARRARVGCLLTLLAAGVVAPTAAEAKDAAGSAPAGVVVVFELGVPSSQRAAVRSRAHARAVRTLGRERFQLLRPAPGQSVDAAVAELRRSPAVAAADPNVTFEPSSIANDSRFNELWGLLNTGQNVGGVTGAVPGADIDATLAWDRTVGDPAVVVADIDSGYLFGHPDLGPVAWTNADETPGNGVDDDNNGYVDDRRGWDTADHDHDPTDPGFFLNQFGDKVLVSSHGVHTAGKIGAKGNNGIGVTGVAQNVRIMPIRALTALGGGGVGGTTASVVEAMNYAGANGARVANMSLGTPGVFPTMLAAQAANPQTLFVVAAGNDATDNETSPHAPCDNPTVAADGYVPPPGTIDNVVCVAATDQADQLASFSNFGVASVDLGAPGTETLSTGFETDPGVYHPDFFGDAFDEWTTPSPPATDPTQGFLQLELEGEVLRNGTIYSDSPPVYLLPRTHEPGTTRATRTPAISVAAHYRTCTFEYALRGVAAGDDSFSWAPSVDGQTVLDRSEEVPDRDLFKTVSSAFELPDTAAAHSVTAQFRFTRGESGADDAWVSMFSIDLTCARAAYRFDAGTSMATPHVSGTAGLLFSLKPSATVTQVRNALLASVDPLASLAGKTTTGGRLNAWKALTALLPMDTRITSGPSGNAKSNSATFTFDTNNTGNAGFQCRLDGGAFQPCTNPKTYNGLPKDNHSFRVRSAVQGGADATPALSEWKSK
jgi:subtilisin family serine protease